jgi:hypothetical protein
VVVRPFTETYLSDRSATTLSRECRFLHGQRQGCSPVVLMRQRQIKSEDIARARADEHSRREDEGSSQNAREDLEKLAFAKAFDGKYEAAAKCFEEAGAGTTTPTLTALNFALPQHLVGDNRLAQAKAVAALAEVGGSMIRELLCGTPTMQATVIVERIGWEHGLTALKGRVRVLHPFYLPLDPA